MEVRTEIRDVRVSYDGLGKMVRYLSQPENKDAKVTRMEFHPGEEKQRDYFSVDVGVPGRDARRIMNYLAIGVARNDPELAKVLDAPIESMDLSARAYNCLAGRGIKTVGEIVTQTESELLEIRSFGKTSLYEVKRKLGKLGLTVGMNLESISSETAENQ